MKNKPSYLKLYQTGELKKRVKDVKTLLEKCLLCGRRCGVNRIKNEPGSCKVGRLSKVSSFNTHFGEEPPISGNSGSGTIFFSYCNLNCVYCQNYPISQLGHGREVESNELASMMLSLQDKGCHNINFVSPTHVIAQILEALEPAIEKGLNIPLVYNSGGFDSQEGLKLLEGIIDIYMPDAKYATDKAALKYSNAPGYAEINKKVLSEMYRQVGDLRMDETGIAIKGLLVRHLVLPDDIARSKQILDFIANKISKNTYMSIMSQYHPAHRSYEYPILSRRISQEEYNSVLEAADRLGLERGWRQIL